MTTTTRARAETRSSPQQREASARAGRASSLDRAPADRVQAALRSLSGWPEGGHAQRRLIRSTAAILSWLGTLAAGGWQARWQRAEEIFGPKWSTWPVDAANPGGTSTIEFRRDMTRGLVCLIKLRIIRPSYAFLTKFGPTNTLVWFRSVVSPDLFSRAERAGEVRGVSRKQIRDALNVLTALVIHLGADLRSVTVEDMLDLQRAARLPGKRVVDGSHAAWQMLVDLGVFPSGTTLRAEVRTGQLSTVELVDRYRIQCSSVRDLLIRYLDERRPGVDYSTFTSLVTKLVANFWADIERHHSGIDTIDLPGHIAQAWKQRVRAPRSGRGPRHYWDTFMAVRAFYQDIAEWALSDPTWAPWAFPSPVRKSDTEGVARLNRATVAAMHQRTRERLPHLLRLADSAERWKNDRAVLLQAATQTAIDAALDHANVTYRRVSADYRPRACKRRPSHIVVEDPANSTLINLTVEEDEAFWAWAVIETLRHTGIRVEELLELTQFAIVSHRLPDTGELVPLLQVVPSKTNEERLLLVTPELASVLAAIISRIRDPDGGVPLVARYDEHECVTGPELPHLFQHRDGFQHKNGWRNDVLHSKQVAVLLTRALARAGITDTTGRPLRYTPHDFRRMFATDAVTGGLPVHIAAKVLGHANINTTQAYTAVYREDLIRTYRAFVDRRRAVRPGEEYREPTDAEWAEFQQHFHRRKVELGDCGRPYGTPCAHEHACVRCPMLRVDPGQRRRLIGIIRNLSERIKEAKANGWRGEVEGLTVSLGAAENKLTGLDRAARNHPGPTPLGMPKAQ